MVLITLQCDQCVRKWLELNYAPHMEVSWWRSQRMCVCVRVSVQQNCYCVILLWFDSILAFAARQRILFNQGKQNR